MKKGPVLGAQSLRKAPIYQAQKAQKCRIACYRLPHQFWAKTGFVMSEIVQTDEISEARANPLLRPWETPFETPPFAEIEPEHFLPAFEQAFADHAAEIAAITHDPSAPDFANTITALERSGKLLSKVSAVF
jgi:hypothetical protein